MGDAADLAGQAPCALEQGVDGGCLEQGQFASCEAEAVLDIAIELISIDAGEMVSNDEALVVIRPASANDLARLKGQGEGEGRPTLT